MQRWGWKITESTQIDNLTYDYRVGGTGGDLRNKLQAVTDGIGGNNMLWDFTDNNVGSDDYAYDANGNLNHDYNKGISSISYNYLNLPQLISVSGKGTVEYTYDTAGNKLKKVTSDNASGNTTTTTYIGDFVYEKINAADDQLHFISMEEGEISDSHYSG